MIDGIGHSLFCSSDSLIEALNLRSIPHNPIIHPPHPPQEHRHSLDDPAAGSPNKRRLHLMKHLLFHPPSPHNDPFALSLPRNTLQRSHQLVLFASNTLMSGPTGLIQCERSAKACSAALVLPMPRSHLQHVTVIGRGTSSLSRLSYYSGRREGLLSSYGS